MGLVGVVAQGDAGGVVASTTVVMTLSAAVPVGDTLIIPTLGSTGRIVSSITDSQGNAYVIDTQALNGVSFSAGICRSQITHALTTADTITVTYNGSSKLNSAVALRYTGLLSPALDQVAPGGSGSQTAGPTNPPSSGASPATTKSDEFVVGAIAVGGNLTRPTVTPTSPYSVIAQHAIDDGVSSARDLWVIGLETTVTGAQTASGVLSINDPWAAVAATYKTTSGQTLPMGVAVAAGAPAGQNLGVGIRANGADITGSAGTYPWAKCVNALPNWSQLEAADNTFTFTPLDVSFQYAIDNGIKCGVRIEMGSDGSPSWIYSANSIGAVQKVHLYTGPSDPTGADTPVPWDPNLRKLWQRLVQRFQTYMQTVYHGKKYSDVCAFLAVSMPTTVGTEMAIGDAGDSRNTTNWNAILNGQTARIAAYQQAWCNALLDAMVNTSSYPISVAEGPVWGDNRGVAMAVADYAKAAFTPSQLARFMIGPTDMRTDAPAGASYQAWNSFADAAMVHYKTIGVTRWAQSAGWSWWNQFFTNGVLKAIEAAWLDDAVTLYGSVMMEVQGSVLGNVAGLAAWCQSVLQPAILAQPVSGGGGGQAAYGPTLTLASGGLAPGKATSQPQAYNPTFVPGAATLRPGLAD